MLSVSFQSWESPVWWILAYTYKRLPWLHQLKWYHLPTIGDRENEHKVHIHSSLLPTGDSVFPVATNSSYFFLPTRTDSALNCDPDKQKQTNSIKLLKSGYFIHSKGFQFLYNCHPSTDFILEKNNTITHKSAIVFSWEEIPEGKKKCHETESMIIMRARNWNCKVGKGKFSPRRIL